MPKVLVVDGSTSARSEVERALTARHVDVVCAGGADEAIARFETDAPDLVVCDVILPDHDGYHVCEHVRAHPRGGGVPVLLLSGLVNSTVLQRAAEVRSNDVLFKPLPADDLARRVEELLASTGAGSTPGQTDATGAPQAAEAASEPTSSCTLNAPGLDVKGCLEQLLAIGGVRAVLLADRDGCLVEAAGDPELSTEATAALAGCLAESSDGLGRELCRGPLTAMVLEYEADTLVVHGVGSSAMLAMVVDDTAVLGKVRYYAKQALAELLRALAGDPLAYRP